MSETAATSSYAPGTVVTLRDDHHWKSRPEFVVSAVMNDGGVLKYKLRPKGSALDRHPAEFGATWYEAGDVDGPPL